MRGTREISDNIVIKLPDGSEKELKNGASAYDVALSISEGLARNSVAAKIDGID